MPTPLCTSPPALCAHTVTVSPLQHELTAARCSVLRLHCVLPCACRFSIVDSSGTRSVMGTLVEPTLSDGSGGGGGLYQIPIDTTMFPSGDGCVPIAQSSCSGDTSVVLACNEYAWAWHGVGCASSPQQDTCLCATSIVRCRYLFRVSATVAGRVRDVVSR